jgi:muramoyltetrapeptide carboxypeptidase
MSLNRRQLMGTLGLSTLGAALPARAAVPDAVPAVLKPARLQAGMTMGLCTPASNAPEDVDIAAAMDFVRSLGFSVKPAPNLFARNQYLAGTDAQRAADLNALFADPEVDAIWCLRGGYGAMRILPDLDYATIARNPKALLGYSDITALHNAIHRRTGLITYHAPIAGANLTDYSYAEYRKVLVDAATPVRIGAPPPFEVRPGVVDRENRLTPIVPGRAEGRLVGGNLTLLVHLLGTPYAPDFDGALLFLEDVYEPPYSIDRMLTHLWLAGALQRCAGVVLGKFTDAGVDGNSFSVEQVLRNRFEPLGIPCLRGLMIGHVEDQTVVPVGLRARLDVDAGSLTLLEAAVR